MSDTNDLLRNKRNTIGSKLVFGIRRETLIILIILAGNVILVSPSLMPDISQINPHDEAKYIESGRLLTKFEIRDLSWGSLVAVVYAPFDLFLRNNPDWFLVEAWIGRHVLFISLWLSTFYLGTKFRDQIHPFIVAGVLFISLPFLYIVINQSDALFASFSAIALAKLISFRKDRLLLDVWLGSAFIGIGILARFESVILLGIFPAICLGLNRKRHSILRILRSALLPAAFVLLVYALLFRMSTGGFDFGVGSKAYASFEWNQSILSEGDLEQAHMEVREIFGTKEENEGSVIRAILNNPTEYGKRIFANALILPKLYLMVFGKKLGPLMLIFASWGIYSLLRQKHFGILAILTVWALQPFVALGFLVLHIIPQVSYFILLLCSIGLGYVLKPDLSRGERITLISMTASLTAYGLLDHKPAFLVGGLVISAAIGVAWLLVRHQDPGRDARTVTLLIVFGAGLIVRDPFPFPNFPSLGVSREEMAIHALQNELDEYSLVLVPYPLPAIASGMAGFDLEFVVKDLTTPEELQDWLISMSIRAIYYDERLDYRPDLSPLIDQGVGNFLEVVFASDDGLVRVLIVKDL